LLFYVGVSFCGSVRGICCVGFLDDSDCDEGLDSLVEVECFNVGDPVEVAVGSEWVSFNGVDDFCVDFVCVIGDFTEEGLCDVECCAEEVEGEMAGCEYGFFINGEL